MELKHVGVTLQQWDETWNALPKEMRFYEEESLRSKSGIRCFQLGPLLLWGDYLLPEYQQNNEVEAELRKVLAA